MENMNGISRERRHTIKRSQKLIRDTIVAKANARFNNSSSDISTDLSTDSSSSEDEEEVNGNVSKRRKLINGTAVLNGSNALAGYTSHHLNIMNHHNNQDGSNERNMIVDPERIQYVPETLTDGDDDFLRNEMAANPIHGYMYYEYLWITLSKVFTTFIPKGKFQFTVGRLVHLKYTPWAKFKEEYRGINTDKEILRNVLPDLDIVAVGHRAVQIRRVIVDLLNHIYIGYTKGAKEFDRLYSHRLLSRILRKERENVNISYAKLLFKEINDFFDLNTGFSNTLNNYATQESFYVSNDSYNVKDTENSLEWTPAEKDIFYEGLARYGIHRANEIADALPNKSLADVLNLYNLLNRELMRYKSSEKLKKKLLNMSDIPAAYEMSEEYIALEERMASQVENIDIPVIKNFKRTKESRKVFNIENINSVLLISREMAILDDFVHYHEPPNITNDVITEIYDIVVPLIYQIIYKTLLNKINSLSIGQVQRWSDMSKAISRPPDPYKMVGVFRGFGDPITSDIKPEDLYDSDADDGADTENDNYLPTNIPLEIEKIGHLDPNGILIPDELETSGLAITENEVKEVCKEIICAKDGGGFLYQILKGKRKLLSKDFAKMVSEKRKIINDSLKSDLYDATASEDDYSEDSISDFENNSAKEHDNRIKHKNGILIENHSEISAQENTSDENLDSDIELDFDSENENENESHQKHSQILPQVGIVPTEHIDEMLLAEKNTQIDHKWYNYNTQNANFDDLVFFDTPIIVPDAIEKDPSGLVSKRFDFTTKGHEYLQVLGDEEEFRMDKKDYTDSIKYENLQLSLLSNIKAEDRDYAEVLSTLKFGGPYLSADSWSSAKGGPVPELKDDKIVANVHDTIYSTDLKDPMPPNYKAREEDLEKFQNEYNDY